jgi:hypothetical protein
VSFSVKIFGAIQIDFSNVAFQLSEDGHKSFTTEISSVTLLPPLDFLSQLKSVLGDLGGDLGINIDLSPSRIQISQTLRFPPSGAEPLFLGPAIITNLSLSWYVTIPLVGRDVLAVGFGVSSREKPLTIFVPPWYGGKSYALLETTTRGCRLTEISMEYGALIPADWGIATGHASLTAGIFYGLHRDDPNNSGTVTFQGFVKAAADLSVAGIIQFAGLIYIALSYVVMGASKIVQGLASISVSIKIAFVRVSYSFTAHHEEAQRNSQSRAIMFSGQLETEFFTTERRRAPTVLTTPRQNLIWQGGDLLPFGASFSREHRAAFYRVINGYRTA